MSKSEEKRIEVQKEPGTAIVTWKEKMAAVTAQASAMAAPKGGFLSFKSGRLSYDDTPIPGDKINVVVIDFLLENTWYKDDYNAMKPASPSCYAFGRDESELEPHDDCEAPQGSEESTLCADCPNNEWGSDRKGGRGKDCKNTRRIAVIPADTLLKGPDAIRKASVVMCKLPVTSIKLFSKFVNEVTKVLDVPMFGVIVELSLTPNPATIFQVNWKVMNKIDHQDILEALYHKYVANEKDMFQPYPKMEEDAPAASASKKY